MTVYREFKNPGPLFKRLVEIDNSTGRAVYKGTFLDEADEKTLARIKKKMDRDSEKRWKKMLSRSLKMDTRHYIISDVLNDVMCPADGKTYDSKSAYYRAVKDAGLVIVGNDAPTMQKQPEYSSSDLRSDIARVMSNYGM